MQILDIFNQIKIDFADNILDKHDGFDVNSNELMLVVPKAERTVKEAKQDLRDCLDKAKVIQSLTQNNFSSFDIVTVIGATLPSVIAIRYDDNFNALTMITFKPRYVHFASGTDIFFHHPKDTDDVFKQSGYKASNLTRLNFNKDSQTWYLMGANIRNTKMHPLRVAENFSPFGSSQNNLYVPMTNLKNDYLLNRFIDNKFFALADYMREAQQYFDNTPYQDAQVSIDWNELLNAKSLNDIKLTKWKRLQKFDLNLKKFSVFELIALKNIRPYIRWEYFYRIAQMVRKNQVSAHLDPRYFMQNVFVFQCQSAVRLTLASDTIRLAKLLDIRLDCQFTSLNGLQRLHDDLSTEYQNNVAKIKYKNVPIFNSERFEPIIKACQDDDRFFAIRTPRQLFQEGAKQHHCVASYADSCIRQDCLIIAGLLNGQRVTIEVKTFKCHNKTFFYANQIQLAFNHAASKQTENDVYALLNNVNTAIDPQFKTSSYPRMSSYHANEDTNHDFNADVLAHI